MRLCIMFGAAGVEYAANMRRFLLGSAGIRLRPAQRGYDGQAHYPARDGRSLKSEACSATTRVLRSLKGEAGS